MLAVGGNKGPCELAVFCLSFFVYCLFSVSLAAPLLSSAVARVTNSNRYHFQPKATEANEQKNDSAEESTAPLCLRKERM